MSSDSDLDQEVRDSEEMTEGSDADSNEIGEESGIENDEDLTDNEDVSGEESESNHSNSDDDDDDDNDDDSDDSNDSSFEANANGSEVKNKNSNQQKQQEIPFNQPKFGKKSLAKIKLNYEERKGKSLFVRFTHRITENLQELEKEVNGLCSGAIGVRRPRQKSTRFCLVDFDNQEDRDKALKELKKAKENGKISVVDKPKTEDESIVQKIIEKRKKKKEEKRAKQKIRKVVKEKVVKEKPKKELTSTVVVKNLPDDTNASQLKELFTNAIEVQVPPKKGEQDKLIATITFPTPQDATKVKRKKYQIAGNNLKIAYASSPRKQVKSGLQASKVQLQGKHKLPEDNKDKEDSPQLKKKKMNFEKQNSPNKVFKKKPFNKKLNPPQKGSTEEGGQVKSSEDKKKTFKQQQQQKKPNQQHPGALLKKKPPQQALNKNKQGSVPSKKPNAMKKTKVLLKRAQLSGKSKGKDVKS